MNPLDRFIGWMNPERGLARMRARAGMDMIASTRGYDGARRGRHSNRHTPSTSANAEVGGGLIRLRDSARDLVRNNPHCARIADIWPAQVIGTGIMPSSNTGNRALDKKVNDLWKRFADQADCEGQLDFYGMQALSFRSVIEGGESLMRFIPRRLNDDLAVPLQMQLLEGDHIDSSKHGEVDGFRAMFGVELAEDGSRRGFWLYEQHPGEAYLTTKVIQSVRVPAQDILHIYRKLRPGQVRGVTAFAPIMTTARDKQDFQEAALMKARIEACFTAFVTSDGEGVSNQKVSQARPETLEPGMINYMHVGEQVTFAQPTSASSFDPFMIHCLQTMAVGAGLTYDQVTGDLRRANYSSLRAGKIEVRRLVEQLQYHMVIPMLCAPVWRRFITACQLSGALRPRAQGYPCRWIAPANEPIDPLKDITADILAVRSGRMTFDEYVSSWGNDPIEQIEKIREMNTLLDAGDIILDIDPRKVARTGTAHSNTAVSEERDNSAENDPE